MKSKRMYPMKGHSTSKRYAPAHYHSRQLPPQHRSGQSRPLFQGNLVQGMRFGGRGHEVSGYVRREIIAKDSQGNIQHARETQFFNSGRKLGRIRILGDESDF